MTNAPAADRRRAPDSVLVAWLTGAAVLLTLVVYVVHHLSGPAASHMSMGQTLFSGAATPITSTLLGVRLITAWQLNVPAVALVTIAAAAYAAAIARRARLQPDGRWPIRSIVAFGLGLLVIVFATCGSIAVYDAALFSAHMLGHLALVMLAPALLVLGHPLRLAHEGSSPATASKIKAIAGGRLISFLTAPPVALASYTAVIVGSHLTGLMNVIMQRPSSVGQLEHLVYLAIGCQFFGLILGSEPLRWQLSTPIRWVLLAVSMAVDTFTGVVLMMSTEPISMRAPAGVGALNDTKTGGAIMWFGGDALMAAIMIALSVSWLGQSGRSARDRASWLEQARNHTLAERSSIGASPATHIKAAAAGSGAIGSAGGTDALGGTGVADIDDNEADHDAYNKWLADIAKRG